MTRLPNWQSALSEYITTHAQCPFRYGVLDCGLLVLDAIQVMTGVDVCVELRGAYSNRKEALTAIEQLCGTPTMESIAEYIAARSDITEVPVLMAQRGDPVVLRNGHRSSLGIVDMNPGYILIPYKVGILRISISHARRAFHIG